MSDLNDFLESCKIPLSKDDWIGFRKELEKRRLSTRFELWIEGDRRWFKRKPRPEKLDERTIVESLILALHQNLLLRIEVEGLKEGESGLRKRIAEWVERQAPKKRDRKPDVPCVTKNWLEPMPVFHEGEPCGYVQATAQRRKKIETFLRNIRAKPIKTLKLKERGKPKYLYGFETNCRILNEWLGSWCDQESETKYDLIVKESLLLAEAIADSKSTVNCKRLARLRGILRTHARLVQKQIGENSNFDFLSSPSACALEIKRLREKFPPRIDWSGPSALENLQAQVAWAAKEIAKGTALERPGKPK